MAEAAVAVVAFALAASAFVYVAVYVANELDDSPAERSIDDHFDVFVSPELYR